MKLPLEEVPRGKMKPCFGHLGRPAALEEEQRLMCHACPDIERCHWLSTASALWEQARALKKAGK